MGLDSDDLPGYAISGAFDQVPDAGRRSLARTNRGHANFRHYLYLGLFNPANGAALMRRVLLKGIDALERDLQRAGCLTFSSTRGREVRSWLDRKQQQSTK